ncbi:hypothetical protein DICSQDRAFT_112435 [Dichomitus squalens LYAD-421 SS1]|uniref:Stealth protein CR3 conserved region 3 domain-containing protein n=1 Tax=Dichomitus squalens (strain LYAD-421) TaxID=732165 RepID=R7SPG2_DICSQ|nr:uncharacterized protein DICSQDRAFT_112435 [Dichomitus squalens LYAD-421 SS1]EJF56867.1 hypothetical protein DICSQDRAFT_112435 [Dichomitus squalens LYAD-421 SS1]
MSSASYIPLTRIPHSEFLWSPKATPRYSLASYLARRRAVFALIVATSFVTLVLFLNIAGSHEEDDYNYNDVGGPVNTSYRPGYQPGYIAFRVPDSLPSSSHPVLHPVRDLPSHCLDQYYSSGGVCHDGLGPLPLDVIWTWVNGSDPLFMDARENAAESFGNTDPYRPTQSSNSSRMFRDYDELRHSLRSVLANFRPHARHFRILTSDFDYPADESGTFIQYYPDSGLGNWRIGLHPQWLDTADRITPEWRDGNIQLSLTHHAHFFEPYNRTIFNSYAIESQFSHLQNISEVFLYMNDDFYMSSPLTPVTFYTQQYGLVLRLQGDMTVSPDWPSTKRKSEWRSMGVSNWLLSKRFGRRRRPYVQHQAKSVSFAILQELALVWPEAIAKTATHAFRETEAGDGDYYQMFMFAHYLVERSREALLWTWVVGRVGGIDDSWGEREAEQAWIEIGGSSVGDESKEVQVESGIRHTLAIGRVRDYLREGGLIADDSKTEYLFSSLDGYAYNEYGRRGVDGWPGFDPEKYDEEDRKGTERKCTIRRNECFGGRSPGKPLTASAVFQNIAFDKPHCGDCVIIALVNASGRLGLSAVLPPPDRRSPPSNTELPTDESLTIPHLPLVDDWHDGQFALRDVMKYAPDTSVRQWSERVMQRYRYVIGGTPSAFEQLLTLEQVEAMLAYLDRRQDIALLCINDDVTQDGPQIAKHFRDWQSRRWNRAAAWEADAGPW